MDLQQMEEVFTYDPDTGEIRWKIRVHGAKKGSIAGNRRTSGYVYIGLCGRRYLAHRIAWLLHYKEQPPSSLDHINHVRHDNRISNLRPATYSSNAWNKSGHSSTGFKGVSKVESGRFRAGIEKDDKCYSLGTFDTPEEASAAYLLKAKELFGDFATTAMKGV